MSGALEKELAEVLAKLGPIEREMVLEYARSLQDHDDDDRPRPSLMEFCGTITKEDAQLMREAIAEFDRV